MPEQKTALERLAFRIAEAVAELDVIYRLLPRTMEERAKELEDFEDMVRKTSTRDLDDEHSSCVHVRSYEQRQKGPSLFSRLRKAVHADEGTPLKVILESAIEKLEDEYKEEE